MSKRAIPVECYTSALCPSLSFWPRFGDTSGCKRFSWFVERAGQRTSGAESTCEIGHALKQIFQSCGAAKSAFQKRCGIDSVLMSNNYNCYFSCFQLLISFIVCSLYLHSWLCCQGSVHRKTLHPEVKQIIDTQFRLHIVAPCCKRMIYRRGLHLVNFWQDKMIV